MTSRYDASRADIDALLRGWGEPKYRAAQLYDGLWSQRAPLEALTSLPKALRTRLASRWGLIPDGVNELTWIIDWPLFEWGDEEGRWEPLHHPFTSPDGDLDPSEPGGTRALAYDVVWNGVELGGGSIRINRADVQQAVFEVLGIGAEEAQERFGFLLDALRYGAPPHGGIAFGMDRVAALNTRTSWQQDIFCKACRMWIRSGSAFGAAHTAARGQGVGRETAAGPCG